MKNKGKLMRVLNYLLGVCFSAALISLSIALCVWGVKFIMTALGVL